MTEFLVILAGLFTIVCTMYKPDFYWNNHKAVSMRKLFGDTGTSIFYYIIGVGVIIIGILS